MNDISPWSRGNEAAARGICLTITIRKQKMFSRVENGRKQNFSLDILVGTVSNSVMPQYMVEKIIR